MALVCCSAQQSPDQQWGLRLQDLLTWDFSWTQDLSPSHIPNTAKPSKPQNEVLQPGVKGRLLYLFPISVKKFPISEPKTHPFCSMYYRMYETSEPNLRTLGVIFTAGAEPLQYIGIINTMSSLYRTRAKLLLIATLEDPNSPHLSLQI